MNPFKLIRKLGRILRGGATFQEMFLGISLGFAIGMIPGVNLTLVLLIFLLLLLNANGVLAALAIALGKALCLALAPVTFHLGHWMIHGLGLVGLVRIAADTPVLALLDLHVYCLMGALPLIVIIGGALAWFVSRSVVRMRTSLAAAVDKSAGLQNLAGNKLISLITRLVFGKQTKTLAEMDKEGSALVRKGRVILALTVLVLLVLGQFLFLNALVKAGLQRSIAAINGAEVNIKSADLSLGSGRLVIDGLQVTDAANPTHNKLQADRIAAQISVRDLLVRRFVVDLIECQALRMDAERKTPGKVFTPPEPTESEPVTSILEKYAGKSAEYYAEVKKFNERLQQLRKYLESDEPDKEALARKTKAMGYLRLSARDYLSEHPTWVIRQITVGRIELRPDLPTLTAEGKNLSSHPSLYPEEIELRAYPDEDALKAFLAKALTGDAKTNIEEKLKDNLLDGLFKKD